MVQFFADASLALEAVGEDGIGFHVRVGDFQGHDTVVANVCSAVDGCHATAGYGASIR